MNELIYVTGHRKPDTDSVISAIAYARLKNKIGIPAVPCRLGKLSQETAYLLERFGVEEPMLLQDARFSLADIDLDKPIVVKENDTIFKALNAMENASRSSLAVVNEANKLVGILSYRDLAKVGLRDTALGIDLLRHATVEAIAETIDGQVIHKADHELNGKVSIVAITRHSVLNYEVQDRIVIAGDDEAAQLGLIKKGAAVLILVWTDTISDEVLAAAREHGCTIIKSGHGSMNTSRYLYFSPPVKLLMQDNVRCFHVNDVVDAVQEQMKNLRYRSYPVINEQDEVVGYVERYHLMRCENKKLILVDHNEFGQSVPGIEQAKVLEVIDHHRVAGFSTTTPVTMRCETVGSTATIVTKIYRERSIIIDKEIAGLLLGAILSDTLKFASPTTTQEDIFTAASLAQIAGLNMEDFAHELFSVTTNIEHMSAEELMNQDVKDFEILDFPFQVSQSFIYDISDLDERRDAIKAELARKAAGRDTTYVAAFTSIQQKGSCFYAAGPKAAIIEKVFAPDKVHANVLSRKNQIIPTITMALAEHS